MVLVSKNIAVRQVPRADPQFLEIHIAVTSFIMASARFFQHLHFFYIDYISVYLQYLYDSTTRKVSSLV